MVQQVTQAALHLFRAPLHEMPSLAFRPGQPLQNLRNFKSSGLVMRASQDEEGWAGDLINRVQKKAKELREAALSRQFKWPKPSSLTANLPKRLIDLEPDIEEGGLVAEAVREGSLGFGFSAGGMLFPYYIGCLEGLQKLGLATEHTHMAGASAGSILAVCHHSGLTTDVIAAACLELAEDCRKNGTRGRLGEVLEDFLHRLLPDDVHERCRGKAHIAVTRAFPRPRGLLISECADKEDLIRTVLTSCHIPLWLNGKLTTTYRGQEHFDGGLTNFIPIPPDLHASVRICCFPAKQINTVYKIQISPDSFEDWPYTLKEMVGWAFEPASEEILVNFISKGRADAEAWALKSGAAAALKEVDEAKAGLAEEDYPALKN